MAYMFCRHVLKVFYKSPKKLNCIKYSTSLQNVAKFSQEQPDTVLTVNEGSGIINPLQTPDLESILPPHFDPLSEPDFFGISEMVSLRQLLNTRVHLGHSAGMWNPLMKPYIYGLRSGMHIIDLDETAKHLRLALNVTAHIAYRDGIILFVNERSQFQALNQLTATDCGAYFVSKWRGGTLTNSYMLLKTLCLPDLIIFLSVPKNKTAIKEAAMCNIPSIGIVDTDCNPNLIMYPVPGNDDTPTAVKLYYKLFGGVITKAKQMKKESEAQENQATKNDSLNVETNT